MKPSTLQLINEMSHEAFMYEFGALFEHSPWIAEKAAGYRPFQDYTAMLDAMKSIVMEADIEQTVDLLRRHPDLGSRLEMSSNSVQEQAGAGLSQLSESDFHELHRLNEAYTQRFGFPFILAVRGHTTSSIIQIMRERVEGSRQEELKTATQQVLRIASIRLEQWVERTEQI